MRPRNHLTDFSVKNIFNCKTYCVTFYHPAARLNIDLVIPTPVSSPTGLPIVSFLTDALPLHTQHAQQYASPQGPCYNPQIMIIFTTRKYSDLPALIISTSKGLSISVHVS
jgi:hypothetical protein